MFGPWVQSLDKDEYIPPFSMSLRIHDMFLHNTVLDSCASHNLMPNVIMNGLGLDITRPYRDLFLFHLRNIKCLVLIKYLVIILHQIPEKSIVVDVVVGDVPTKFGILLSRSWETKLKGTLQMDMSCATIPIFSEQRRLYRENHLAYMISNKDIPENHLIYAIDTDMGFVIFYNDLCFEESDMKEGEGEIIKNQQLLEEEKKYE